MYRKFAGATAFGESFAKSDGQLAAQIGEPSANCVVLCTRKRTVESETARCVRGIGKNVGVAVEKPLRNTSHGRLPNRRLEKFHLTCIIVLDDFPEELFFVSKSKVEARRGDVHSTGEITERCAFIALSPEKFGRRLDGRVDVELAWTPHSYSAIFYITHYITLTPPVRSRRTRCFLLGGARSRDDRAAATAVRYCIKCAMVCESLKTVLDASLPSRTAHTLELRPSSVYRKLCSRRVGCVNRQECHGFGNFLRLADTLHRNALRHLKVDLICRLLRHSYLLEYGRFNWTRAHRIDTYSTGQQLTGKAPSNGTKRCFSGAVSAQWRHRLHVGHRSGKDHRTSFRHERHQFLDDEIRSLGVQVEHLVVNFLSHRLKWDKSTISRVDEQHIELAERLLDLLPLRHPYREARSRRCGLR